MRGVGLDASIGCHFTDNLPQDKWDKFSSFRYKTVDSYEDPAMLVSLRGLCKNGTLILIESAFIQPRTLVSQTKRLIFVSLRGRSAAVAILKLKARNPVAKHGSARREEIPITEAARRAVPPSPLSPPHFQIPVRSVSSCFVPEWQIVPFKIAASGARALLAMTNLIGLPRLDHGIGRTETR